MSCGICGGSRHVWNGSAWEACSCLHEDRALSRYRRAGIPVWLDGITWREFLRENKVSDPKTLLSATAKLRRGELPDEWLMIHGRPSRVRTTAASLVLRAACDARLATYSITLPVLIDIEFDRERAKPEVLDGEVLSIRIGSEPPHRWNGYVLEKVFRSRASSGLFTMVSADVDPSRLGTLYRSTTVTDTLSRQFAKVRVGEAE